MRGRQLLLPISIRTILQFKFKEKEKRFNHQLPTYFPYIKTLGSSKTGLIQIIQKDPRSNHNRKCCRCKGTFSAKMLAFPPNNSAKRDLFIKKFGFSAFYRVRQRKYFFQDSAFGLSLTNFVPVDLSYAGLYFAYQLVEEIAQKRSKHFLLSLITSNLSSLSAHRVCLYSTPADGRMEWTQ